MLCDFNLNVSTAICFAHSEIHFCLHCNSMTFARVDGSLVPLSIYAFPAKHWLNSEGNGTQLWFLSHLALSGYMFLLSYFQ